jgi:hypothetical protein
VDGKERSTISSERSCELARAPASRWVHASFAPHGDDAPRVTVAVLSPHFDDAVLSCWHVLSQPGPLLVVNVFAGAPPEDSPPGWWDRRTGATDARARVLERAGEDRLALARAGRTAVNLDLPESQHRRRAPTVADVAARVRDAISGSDGLYAPAGLGAHPDHMLVRDAALELQAEEGRVLVLYADLPHAIRRGWPTWVAPDGDAIVNDEWAIALAGLRGLSPRPHVHALDAVRRTDKLAAVRLYGTQLAGLEQMAFGPLERVLRYEVTWEVALA